MGHRTYELHSSGRFRLLQLGNGLTLPEILSTVYLSEAEVTALASRLTELTHQVILRGNTGYPFGFSGYPLSSRLASPDPPNWEV